MSINHRRATIAIALVAVAIVAFIFVRPSPVRGSRTNADQDARAATTSSPTRSPDVAGSRLAAQEQQRELRDAMLRQSILAAQDEQTRARAAAVDPVAQTMDVLDTRMERTEPSPQNTANMSSAIQAIIRSGALGETKATFVCGATICRVELTDTEAGRVEQAVGTFAERTPKLFSSTLVFPDGPSGRKVYVSSAPGALALDSTEDLPSASITATDPPAEK